MRDNQRLALTEIHLAGLRAVEPENAVKVHVRRSGNDLHVGERSYALDDFERIILVGAGKGAAPMAKAVEDVLGDRLAAGWITVKYGHGLSLKKTRVMEAGHPIPDEAGLEATRTLLARLGECSEHDLVVGVFSGGGSALLPAPCPAVSLEEKKELTRLLLECGASIDEINAVRKHLSRSKGGGLAKAAHPATVVSLLLSDVIGDRPDVIASGPTAPDVSTFADALETVERYGLTRKISTNVLGRLNDGAAGRLEETPKPGDPLFAGLLNLVVGNNRAALNAAADRARALGFHTLVLSSGIRGEAREVAKVFAAVGREVVEAGHPVAAPACILAGGEPTVTVRGPGKGGRSQELALAFAIAVDGMDRLALLAAGTDGTDGPTDAAGAFADGHSCDRALRLGLIPREFLARNDSYNFFAPIDQLFKTGPTRTNVMDLFCLIVDRE